MTRFYNYILLLFIATANAKTSSWLNINTLYNPPPPDACPETPIISYPGLEIPKPRHCEIGSGMNALVANGCVVDKSNLNSLGMTLARSTVGIVYPYLTGRSVAYWELSCSGTIVDQKWVLTAAHCIADYTGRFNNELSFEPVYVVPWDLSYNGVPKTVPISYQNKYRVKAIYIANDYNYYPLSNQVRRPYDLYGKKDFALLELDKPLPDIKARDGSNWFIPLELATDVNVSQGDELWFAGYGYKHNQRTEGQLSYRPQYYMSQVYPGIKGIPGDYDEIYTVGSIPEQIHSEAESSGSHSNGTQYAAWSLLGRGDSGGGMLYYDRIKQKFLVLGVLTGGLSCSWSGFFAPLPYVYDRSVSVPKFAKLLNSIINDTAKPNETRCISSSNGCKAHFAYIANYASDTISYYKLSKKSGELVPVGAIGGNNLHKPNLLLSDPSGKFLVVLNRSDGNGDYLTSYQIDSQYGTIISLEHSAGKIYPGLSPSAISFDQSGRILAVINYDSNNISIYEFNSGYFNFIGNFVTGKHPSSLSIANGFIYVTNSGDNTISIYRLSNLENITQNHQIKTGPQPIQIKVDPSNHFAVVVNSLDSTLSTYRVETNGYLDFISKTETIHGTNKFHQIVFSPESGRYLYMTNYDSHNIVMYQLDNITGHLSYIAAYSTGVGNPYELTIDSSGDDLYATTLGDNKVLHWQINPINGRLIGSPGNTPKSVAVTGYVPLAITLSN